MHKLESVVDKMKRIGFSQTQKRQTHHRMYQPKRPNLLLINKKKVTFHLVDFADPDGPQSENKESEKIVKYLKFTWELKKKKQWTWKWRW